MDWTQTFTTIGVIGSFVIYMMNRMEKQMDAKFGQMDAKFGQMDAKFAQMDAKIDLNQKQTNEKFEALGNRMTAMEVETKTELKNINQRIGDLKTDINQRLGTIEGYLVPKKVYHFEEPHKEEPKEN